MIQILKKFKQIWIVCVPFLNVVWVKKNHYNNPINLNLTFVKKFGEHKVKFDVSKTSGLGVSVGVILAPCKMHLLNSLRKIRLINRTVQWLLVLASVTRVLLFSSGFREFILHLSNINGIDPETRIWVQLTWSKQCWRKLVNKELLTFLTQTKFWTNKKVSNNISG